MISDAGMIYFDARPSARYPTVEIRVADACPLVDDAVLLAALARALVHVAAAEDAAGRPLPEAPQVLLRAATWRAARSGLSGHLVDPSTRSPLPAGARIDALLAHVRPALEARGEWETAVDLLEDLRARGTVGDPAAARGTPGRSYSPWRRRRLTGRDPHDAARAAGRLRRGPDHRRVRLLRRVLRRGRACRPARSGTCSATIPRPGRCSAAWRTARCPTPSSRRGSPACWGCRAEGLIERLLGATSADVRCWTSSGPPAAAASARD